MIAEHLNHWLVAFRLAVLAVGTFNVGLCLYVLIRYMDGYFPPSPYHRRAHVIAISFSYILLTSALCTEIGLRAVRDLPIISYRLAFGALAFPLGTYALAQLIRHANHRRED